MRRIKKYATKASTVIDTETINWKSTLTPYEPTPNYIGSVKNAQCSDYKHNSFEYISNPAFGFWHCVKHLFKNFLYAVKLFGNLVHTLKSKWQGRSCQASGFALGGLPLPGTLRMTSRATSKTILSFFCCAHAELAGLKQS